MGSSRKAISQKEIPLYLAVVWSLRVYAQKLIVEFFARINREPLQALKDQTTALNRIDIALREYPMSH